MAETWTCPRCGQILPLSDAACQVCRITRENRGVVGRIATPERTPKPPPEKVEIPFPFTIREARFNLPLASGSVWSSGTVLCVTEGLFLVSEKDGLDPAALAAQPPAAAKPVGPTSIFIHRTQLSRVVHHKLTGYFIEVKGPQKIPLRLEAQGWSDLDVVCDQLGIPHS